MARKLPSEQTKTGNELFRDCEVAYDVSDLEEFCAVGF